MNNNNSKIIRGALFLFVLLLSACGDSNSNLGIAGKAWRTAVLIETSNGDAYAPQIAFYPNGNALAVWEQSDGTTQRIYANRYTASSGVWGTAAPIENDTGEAKRPQIAIDASGNALAVWYQFNGTYRTIRSNRYTSLGWGTAAPIETGNVGDALDPQIAIDINGNALAVWNQDGDATASTRYDIWANRYTPAGWGTPVLIETNDPGTAFGQQVAIDPSGNALVVWEQYGGSVNDVWANRYTAGTDTWDTASLIETDNLGSADAPQIAIDANGNGLAVWQQYDGMRYNITANRYTAGSAWGSAWWAAAAIESDNTSNAIQPQIAFDTSGNALAIWQQNTVSGVNIWANRYAAGSGTWGTAALVENNSVGTSSYPQIAFDTSGNALAVWYQNDGLRTNILANRYAAGTGTWGTATLIETDNAGSADSPQIAIDANGNALAVWEQTDGTRYNIWANRYQ